ncbi:MAG: V-type ATPase subunit [Sphaerochaetaceae bacterium]|jgi:V/A-type H+-transporting ATPase subunit C
MKSAASRYGFINAKLRARIGRMMDDHVVNDMIRSGSLVEAVQVLRDTQYAPVAEAYDRTGDIQALELVLLQGEIAMYEEVAGYLDGKPAEFVRVLLEKIEIDNLKNAIRLWYSNIVRHHSISYRGAYIFRERIVHAIDWAMILNAVQWDEVLKAVSGTPYLPVLERYTFDSIVEDGLFEMETSLDKLWYEHLQRQAKSLSRRDRAAVEKVYGIDIDLKNVLMLVRFGWYHRLSSERLRQLLIPGGTIYGSKDIESFLSMEPPERNPSLLLKRRYADLAKATDEIAVQQNTLSDSTDAKVLERKNEIIAAQTLRIEQYLGKMRKKQYLKILSGYPFTLGVVLAYFFLYKRMDQMIRAAISGKYYGWSEERIREVMV